jgi:hypothetical protein
MTRKKYLSIPEREICKLLLPHGRMKCQWCFTILSLMEMSILTMGEISTMFPYSKSSGAGTEFLN